MESWLIIYTHSLKFFKTISISLLFSALKYLTSPFPHAFLPLYNHLQMTRNKSKQRKRKDRNQETEKVSNQGVSKDKNRSTKYEVKMSRRLVSILRHNAMKLNIKMDARGFVKVNDLLRRNEFKNLDHNAIKHIVETNDKQRLSLKYEDNELLIRANQGHSIHIENLALKPILKGENFDNVIHGTYLKAWHSAIKKEGLSRMNRMHIHFAIGEPGERGVVSGMRSSCQVMIYLNLDLALNDGLTFFLSENNVILTEGDKDGFVRPKYFQKVIERKSRRCLFTQ
ncbi:tRNA 2'-phosphotransferase 1 [Octopus bimaculoides]|uniref:2'-phosphotransferase n=1 Tax=Octopus bimaculoides TaxID=37653 RepID=A0A0L8G4Y6_OCTBM|nr:tRNA 2'-phosphotransferase 1 [Octopus bimaculoides]|eukprot:XP_014784165.1 PREDICTED: tRNA 2'-phosphotransferase 1-like [Octopus bimaculoides]